MNKNKTFRLIVCCLSALLIIASTVIIVKNKTSSTNAVFSQDSIFLNDKQIEQLQKEHFKELNKQFNYMQSEIDAMQQSILRPIDNSLNKSEFTIETKQNESEYQIIVSNHGIQMDLNSVNIEVQPHKITLSADYNVSNVSDKNGKKESFKSQSSFYRSFTVEETLDYKNVNKQVIDNKLVITIPIRNEAE